MRNLCDDCECCDFNRWSLRTCMEQCPYPEKILRDIEDEREEKENEG